MLLRRSPWWKDTTKKGWQFRNGHSVSIGWTEEKYIKGEKPLQASTHVHNLVLQIRIRSYSNCGVHLECQAIDFIAFTAARIVSAEFIIKSSVFLLTVIAATRIQCQCLEEKTWCECIVNRTIQSQASSVATDERTAESICTTTSALVRVMRSHGLVVAFAIPFVMPIRMPKKRRNQIQWNEIPCECIQIQLQI